MNPDIAHESTREKRPRTRETKAVTLRDLLQHDDQAAQLLATMYEIGGMAVVA